VANGVEKLIRSLTNRIRNSATRVRLESPGSGTRKDERGPAGIPGNID